MTSGEVIAGGSSEGIFDFADSVFGDGIDGKAAGAEVLSFEDGAPGEIFGGDDDFVSSWSGVCAALRDEGTDSGDETEDDSEGTDENGSGLHWG